MKKERESKISKLVGKRAIPKTQELEEIKMLVDDYDYNRNDDYSNILLLAVSAYTLGKIRGEQESKKGGK